jgi:hypothetical protein
MGRLILRPGAILTPAARDLLRERGIEISRREAGSDRHPGGGASGATHLPRGKEPLPRLVVGGSGCRIEQQAALDTAIAQSGWYIERVELGQLGPLVTKIAGQVAKGSCRGLLVTDQAAVAVCMANRLPGVRAAHVSGRGDVEEAIGTLNPNVLIIKSDACHPRTLEEMLTQYGAAPSLDCPAAYVAQLG